MRRSLSSEQVLERAHQEHWVRLLALLTKELRSLDMAEDALQDAFVQALASWDRSGVPGNPAGWLLTTARRRAIDRQRREAMLTRKLPLLVTEEAADSTADDDVTEIADERLRLVFTACHPSLAQEARVALTLRYVGGLSTRAVARLFLVSESTMAARITRAKKKIAEAGIPYRIPSETELPGRLASVLAVVYLLFTEGYVATAGDHLLRVELADEAIRLGRLLTELMPDESEVLGLLGLMIVQHARRDARLEEGQLVLLADQERSRWWWDEIGEGIALINRAGRTGATGPYILQARIAAKHTTARQASDTDWHGIARLYAELEGITDSPVVRSTAPWRWRKPMARTLDWNYWQGWSNGCHAATSFPSRALTCCADWDATRMPFESTTRH